MLPNLLKSISIDASNTPLSNDVSYATHALLNRQILRCKVLSEVQIPPKTSTEMRKFDVR